MLRKAIIILVDEFLSSIIPLCKKKMIAPISPKNKKKRIMPKTNNGTFSSIVSQMSS